MGSQLSYSSIFIPPPASMGGGMVFMEWGLGVGESRVWVNMAMRDGVPN